MTLEEILQAQPGQLMYYETYRWRPCPPLTGRYFYAVFSDTGSYSRDIKFAKVEAKAGLFGLRRIWLAADGIRPIGTIEDFKQKGTNNA